MFRLKCKHFNLKDRRPKNAVFGRLSPLVAAHAPGGTCLEKKLFLYNFLGCLCQKSEWLKSAFNLRAEIKNWRIFTLKMLTDCAAVGKLASLTESAVIAARLRTNAACPL